MPRSCSANFGRAVMLSLEMIQADIKAKLKFKYRHIIDARIWYKANIYSLDSYSFGIAKSPNFMLSMRIARYLLIAQCSGYDSWNLLASRSSH